MRSDVRSLSLRGQVGVALVLVLWMLVLLTVIANSLVFSSRTELLAAANVASVARAEALADAGVYMAIHQLSTAQVAQSPAELARWKADGLARLWRYREVDLKVTIIDESGKIDLNTAAPPLLIGLLTVAGVDQVAAEALVDAILDWRDADDLRRLHGAEKDSYASAGRDYVPANLDFETVDELRQVLGMNDTVFSKIEPFITVHSRQVGVNSAVAPREVLLALPGAVPEQVDAFVAQRQALLQQGQAAPPFPAAQGFATQPTASTYSIQVEVALGDNARFFRQAVVRMTRKLADPVTFLAWRAPSGGW